MVRDYSLLGPSAKEAEERGLVAAKWYHSDISTDDLKRLMQRKDLPAIKDTLLYYFLLGSTASFGIYFWGSLSCIPFWIIYSLLYTSGADSRWHEAGHRTAFKTQWMNKFVYQIACFMLLRNPVLWRWKHLRHHSDTIIVGRDLEIATKRPPNLLRIYLSFFGLPTFEGLRVTFRHALKGLNEEEKVLTPTQYVAQAQKIARLWVLIITLVVIVALVSQSILPLMLVCFGPAVFGSWHLVMTSLLQHAGLSDDVLDHRLNSRTVYLNCFSRFIYWNMNYHIEHHMFPMVPFHNLPRLHQLIKDDLPKPNQGFKDGLKEVFYALKMQLNDPEYYIKKELPPTAKPYNHNLSSF